MELNIALLKGDGIGVEIIDSAVAVLEKTASIFVAHSLPSFSVTC